MAGDTTCELRIDRKGGVLLILGKDEYEGVVQHSERTRVIVERLDRFVNHHPGGEKARETGGCEKIDLELLGAVLFDILLGDRAMRLPVRRKGETDKFDTKATLGDLVGDAVQRVGDTGRFRLTLEFEDETSPLATYPWECLFVGRPNSADGYFLSEKATLMRLVPPTMDVAPGDQLDIVVAWAEPGGALPGLDGEKLHASITTALDGKVHALVQPERDVTWERLMAQIVDRPAAPDILHLIAHGRRNGATMELALCPTKAAKDLSAALASRTGLPPPPLVAWTSIAELKAALEQRRAAGRGVPRLVFLHACNSGRAEQGVEAFRGAAEVIARAGVPFVVAMQYEIENRDAQDFTARFYETLADPAATVDDAVREGRRALGLRTPSWGHRRFATPVVYLRNETAHLLRAGALAPRPEPDVRDDSQPCPACTTGWVSRLGKTCSCHRNAKSWYKTCANGHFNKPDAGECWRDGCDARFEVSAAAASAAATAPTAPPARAPSRGGLEA